MRLTTDNPASNCETALNLFYGAGNEAMVRGPAPDYPDVTLHEYIREIIKAHKAEIPVDCSDEELDDTLYECLFDGPEEIEGLIATLYTAGWAFAELRHRLKEYEDAEESGRLIVVPCKPGDTVYRITGPHGRKRVVPREVLCVTYAGGDDWWITSTACDELGKTVFLSEQEAEKALSKMKNGGNK